MSNDFSEFLKLIQPKLSFEESIHPSKPDYSDKYNCCLLYTSPSPRD